MSLNAKINRSLTISRKPRKQRANKNRKVDLYNTTNGTTTATNGMIKKDLCQNLRTKESKDQTLAHQVITQTANKEELSMILEQSEPSNSTSGINSKVKFELFDQRIQKR